MLLFLYLQLLPWQLLAREKHYFNCLFSFCGESSTPFSDWTHLSGRFRNSRFRITCKKANYKGWISDPLLLEGDDEHSLKYLLSFLWQKSNIRRTTEALFNGCYAHTPSNRN